MNAEIKRGSLEMTAAMLISGSIGWFVLMSGQPVVNVVFWRCAVGRWCCWRCAARWGSCGAMR